MVHALFKADSAPSFAAPIVEFAWFKLKDGTSLDAVAGHMDKLVAADTATVVSATWGPVREEGREFQFVMVVGWQSHEAHMAAVQSPTENVKKLVADIMEFSTVQTSHSKMVAYP
ncbi:hypothetical protein BV22DRAFT_1069238 [Leucogyrophana mollusca]|uniref:Uncharacterized protein n=1 Tax=Leucogyrophana mollusca TaxID=85980 RepID=A0ACB8BCH8_9AGAM|nr:hypothetical protein BV22DRAFT_1069238 [Leucogyrophana mollusca]